MTADGKSEAVEPIIKWLFYMVIFLVIAMIGISKWSPEDGSTFQVMSNLATGFAGALIGRITPTALKKQEQPPGSTTVMPPASGSATVVSQVTETNNPQAPAPEGK